jgi:hypothetical protein
MFDVKRGPGGEITELGYQGMTAFSRSTSATSNDGRCANSLVAVVDSTLVKH